MKRLTQLAALTIAIALASSCGGGVKVKGSSDGASVGNAKEVTLEVDIKGTGSGFNLAPSPVVTIYAQRLNFTMDCTDGGGTATDLFTATGTSSGSADYTATFSTTVPKYCDTASIVVVSLVGKFGNATTGMTFTLNESATATTYRASGWSVHASLDLSGGVLTALFEFDKAGTADTDSDTLTARETINGTITVDVNDRCAGAATITPDATSVTAFGITVPHTLTSPVQWTEVISDTTLAVSPYTEDSANNAGYAEWTFDFASATVTDAAVQYRLTVAGSGDMKCIAVVTFSVTATDGTPTTIP